MMTNFSPRNLVVSIEGTSSQFVCDIKMILSALDEMIRKPADPDLVIFIIGIL
jgi:hypothetical protein